MSYRISRCTCGAEDEYRAHSIDPWCPALDPIECPCGVVIEGVGFRVLDDFTYCSEACYDRSAEVQWFPSAPRDGA